MSLLSLQPILIRACMAADVPQVQAIYAWNVEHGTGTFELEAPSVSDIQLRLEGVTALGLPWIVAERDGVIVGFAYANLFRPRRAFRFCAEDSVYLSEDTRVQGIGRMLLAELIARSAASGVTQMVAVIGDSHNAGSIGLHRALGFEHSGVLTAVGWKFGRWVDVVLMQRSLGAGATTDPDPA
jgi:phosphinothricin acetyltransferase